MTFQTGDYVKVVRRKINWGKLDTDLFGLNNFYYGCKRKNVAIGSVGRIKNTDHYHGSLIVDFQDNYFAGFHPDEIKIIDGREKIIAKLGEVESHPLLEMAKAGPVFVLGGKVYTSPQIEQTESRTKKQQLLDDLFPSEKTQQTSADYFTQRNFLFRSRTIPLTETIALETLEEMASARNDEALRIMARTEAGEIDRKFFIASGHPESTPEVESIKNYIVDHVFPYFRGDQYKKDIEKLLDPKIKHAKKFKKAETRDELFQKLTNELEEYAVNNVLEPIQKDKIAFDDIALINGIAYRLIKTDKSANVVLGGNNYRLSKLRSVKSIAAEEKRYLCEEVLKQIKNEFTSEGIKERCPKNLPSKLKIGDYGFEVDEDVRVYATMEVPEFFIKRGYDGGWYHFKGGEFGVRVKNKEGLWDSQIYRKVNDSWKPLCTGRAELPESGKDRGEVVAKRLNCIKAMVWSGISGDWYHYDDYKLYDKSSEITARAKNLAMDIPIIEVTR